MDHQETSSGNTVTRTIAPDGIGACLVLGIELIASGASPVQCFANFQVPSGSMVYYDSQSIGEGLGVRFVYRGQAVLLEDESMAVTFSATGGSPQWSLSAWGLALPFNGIT
jgi:hypothetical protein